MNNKKLLIGVVVLVIVLIGVVSFVFSANKKSTEDVSQVPAEENVEKIDPKEIGLTLTASSDNKKVVVEVAKTDGIESLEYELSYISKGDIPRGIIGQLDIKKEGEPVKQEITLGTCSDVCHYDEDVSDLKLVLKVTKTNGKTYQSEQTLEL